MRWLVSGQRGEWWGVRISLWAHNPWGFEGKGNRDVGYTFFLTWEPPRRKEYSHKHELQPCAVTWVPVQFAHHLRPQLDLLPVIPSGPSCTAVLLGDQAKYKSLSTVLCWSHGKSLMHCIHFFCHTSIVIPFCHVEVRTAHSLSVCEWFLAPSRITMAQIHNSLGDSDGWYTAPISSLLSCGRLFQIIRDL